MYETLRSEDFRSVYHLLGECTELWLDPAAWQDHLLGSVSRLIHLPLGLHAEVDHFASPHLPKIIEGRDHGWPDAASRAFYQSAILRHHPFTSAPLETRFRRLVSKHRHLTLPRAGIVDKTTWRRSEIFNLAHHPVQMDELIYSAIGTGPGGRVNLLVFGGPKHLPTKRDCELLDFLHRELIPLRQSRLTSENDYSIRGLSPRRREILSLIAQGLTEKQIAARLGLRTSTVNEQIQQLYRHFGVHTRARLLAYLLGRRPRSRM